LKVLLRLCHDAKAFANFNSFERSIVLVTEIAKQNEGWLKSHRLRSSLKLDATQRRNPCPIVF